MSLRARIATRLIKYRVKRHDPPLVAIRKGLESVARRYPAPSANIKVEVIDADGIPCMWVTQRHHPIKGAVLFLHGGGYCFGSSRTHRQVITYLSRISGLAVLAPDYRLAPENPFPAALDDARTSWNWLHQNVRELPLFIGGDSAGGGLCYALQMNLRDAGLPMPSASFTWSPWTDLALTGGSLDTNSEADAYVKRSTLETMANNYLAGTSPMRAMISPLYGDLKGLPPTLIQVSDTEILLDDSRRMADKLECAGVATQLDIWKRMPHVWHVLLGWVPESKAAIRGTARFLENFYPA